MEAPRLFVVNEIRRHARIEFSPKPVQIAPAPAPKKSRFGKRTAKLTPEAVREIKAAWRAGIPVAELAARHGVSKIAVNHVLCGRSWSDVK